MTTLQFFEKILKRVAKYERSKGKDRTVSLTFDFQFGTASVTTWNLTDDNEGLPVTGLQGIDIRSCKYISSGRMRKVAFLEQLDAFLSPSKKIR